MVQGRNFGPTLAKIGTVLPFVKPFHETVNRKNPRSISSLNAGFSQNLRVSKSKNFLFVVILGTLLTRFLVKIEKNG